MVLRDIISEFKSIANNFDTLTNITRNSEQYDSVTTGVDLLTEENKVISNLKKLEIRLDSINENLTDNALDSYTVPNLRINGIPSNFESILLKISELVHRLEYNFDDYKGLLLSLPKVGPKENLLLNDISKAISEIIKAFNYGDSLKSLSPEINNQVNFEKIQNKIINSSLSLIKKELDSNYLEHKSSINKMINEFEDYMSKVRVAAESDFAKLENQLDQVTQAYAATKIELQEKSDQMDEVLGHTANRVMANDYDSSAVSEKNAANWLRVGSLACMAIIVGIVCYSFYDSTHSGFDWKSSIFRTVLVFILSIPAAYLSRESTKHREQQYNYHHTALDLKAITPYIASLPEADQNRIKISIAERIFASRQTNVAQQESFPLNTQELMMELLKKVNLKEKLKNEDKPVLKSES